MGIKMDPVSIADLRAAGVSRGVRADVQRDLPADKAGMETGDIIFEVEGQPVGDPDALMDAMVKKMPGDTVTLRLVRGTERMKLTVTLMERPANAGTRMGLPEYLSGEISHMQGPFSRVIQHDSVMRPNTMGGPLVDTDGRCVGLNIARADRTSTYAISARDMTEIYNTLKSRR
jgi:serine protease Do